MYFAMETPFRLGGQLRRPNRGYAVDNLKNNFTFYMPLNRPPSKTKTRKRSCTFPSIKKNAPLRQILLQDHYNGEMPFFYSLEGTKITCESSRRTPETSFRLHHRTQSMSLSNLQALINTNSVSVLFICSLFQIDFTGNQSPCFHFLY